VHWPLGRQPPLGTRAVLALTAAGDEQQQQLELVGRFDSFAFHFVDTGLYADHDVLELQQRATAACRFEQRTQPPNSLHVVMVVDDACREAHAVPPYQS